MHPDPEADGAVGLFSGWHAQRVGPPVKALLLARVAVGYAA